MQFGRKRPPNNSYMLSCNETSNVRCMSWCPKLVWYINVGWFAKIVGLHQRDVFFTTLCPLGSTRTSTKVEWYSTRVKVFSFGIQFHHGLLLIWPSWFASRTVYITGSWVKAKCKLQGHHGHSRILYVEIHRYSIEAFCILLRCDKFNELGDASLHIIYYLYNSVSW